jgi:hypothetical protein
VDLEDVQDCFKAIEILRRRVGRGCEKGRRGRHAGEAPRENVCEDAAETSIHDLPLPQKLGRIQSRGMWKHLVKIAQSAQQPLSLPELDALLDLPKNKMRSLKAIMAKLEYRFGLEFLKVAPDAGVDAAGNPRYIMLPKVRRNILRMAGE